MSGEHRKQFNAIFLAAIMLASVVAMSGVFVGGAAAEEPQVGADFSNYEPGITEGDADAVVGESENADYDSIGAALEEEGADTTILVKSDYDSSNEEASLAGDNVALISIVHDNVKIISEAGPEETQITKSIDRIIDIEAENVVFQGFNITNAEQEGIAVIDTTDASGIEIRDNKINSSKDGIVVGSTARISVATTNEILIANNEIEHDRIGINFASRVGDDPLVADKPTIRDNTITGDGERPGRGIALGSAKAKVTGATVEMNLVESSDYGFQRADTGDTVDSLTNNHFLNNGRYNIENNVEGSIDATENWFGTADKTEIESKIGETGGTVKIDPWYIDEDLTKLSDADTFVVNKDGSADFSSIQAAVDVADEDTSIKIQDGKYEESVVIGTSGLTLEATDGASPTIDASGYAHGIEIPVGVNNVKIQGLSISNSNGQGIIAQTESSSPEPSEPSADDHSNIEIRNNVLSGHGDNGVYLGDTDGATIVGNTLQNNGGDGEFPNAGNGILLIGGNSNVEIKDNTFDTNEDSGLYLDDFAGLGQRVSSIEGNGFTGHSEADFRVESASSAGSINGENGQSGQLQYVIINNDITTTNPVTVSDVQLTNPSGKELALSVTTTGNLETGTGGELEVSFTSGTSDGDDTLKTGDSNFNEQDNGDGTYTYTATVDADVSAGNSKTYQATVDKVDQNTGSLPSSGSLDVSVASIGTDGSTTIDTGSTTVSSANIQSNADTSGGGGGGDVTTSVSNDVPTTGSQSRQNLEEDVSSVDENAQVVSAVNINPSDLTVQTTSATLEFTLARSNVGEPSNIRVVRFNDNTNSYESLPTSVISTTSTTITVQAQTPGFSLFAIVETDPPEPLDPDPLNLTASNQTVAAGENVTLTVTNDATGEPVADAAVELPNQTVRTNTNGSVTVAFNTTGNLTLKTTGNIDASYSPDSLTLTVQSTEGAPEPPLGGIAGEFDGDGDGEISISELASAGQAYTSGELSISELADVGAAYTGSD